MTSRTISLDYLSRVEGEGAFKVVVRDGAVKSAELRIFEPPRFFEAFLKGRDYAEVPDITARICGICPVAYQMSAVHALEDAFGVKIDGPIRALRRLLYCGEWIESNTLHAYMLHAPDFLGYSGAIEMAKDHGDIVRRGLELKKIGNELLQVVGGREIHPINIRVGGFYRAPAKRDLQPIAEKLKWARDAAKESISWVSGFEFPDHDRDYEFVALRHPDEYPFNEGNIISSAGMNIPVQDYEAHFEETHVPHSTALQSHIRGRGAYLTGPLARFNMNFDQLSPLAQEAAREVGLEGGCRNPFRSIQIRLIEVLWACDEALRIIESYEEPDAPAVPIEPRAGTGYGATEAPRGMLYHRYKVAEDGAIETALIVPPTSQNQPSIEEDLTEFVSQWLDLSDDEIQLRCETSVRNYDPCISCATHFLRLDIDRT